MLKNLFIATLVILSHPAVTQNITSIRNGEIWPDTDGKHINAHGGGIMVHDGIYFWFGESRLPRGEKDRTSYGVGCYSSKDLLNWKNEGLALRVINDTSSLLQPGCVIERPKVLFNRKTGKFVMWFHHELKGQGYRAAMTGVAVSDNITGPYRYIKSLRPNAGSWPVNLPEEYKKSEPGESALKSWSDEWIKAVKEGLFVRRDYEGGQMARDMTLYVDRNGRAYHIHSSEENMTLHFSELTDDYLDFTGIYYRVLPGESNEAPAVFYSKGKYFMFSSGTTGWKPNPGRLSSAVKLTGEWTALGNPCRGTDEENKITFGSQSTFVLRLPNEKNKFIFMGDRWKPENLADSRHIWLPVEWEDNKPVIRWHDEIDFSKLPGSLKGSEKYKTQNSTTTSQTNLRDNKLSEREQKEGWRLLFDGSTSAGWINAKTGAFPASGWEISDGTLTINPESKKQGEGGDIVTTEKFRNFELSVDFRYATGANSGIKYFIDIEAQNGSVASIGCEYQILDDRNHPDAKAGFQGNRTLAGLYDLLAPENKHDNGDNQWNRATIIVRGNKVQHWLNGFMTLEYERASPEWRELVAKSKFSPVEGFGEATEGRILLQDHGTRVSFKNIKIREIM